MLSKSITSRLSLCRDSKRNRESILLSQGFFFDASLKVGRGGDRLPSAPEGGSDSSSLFPLFTAIRAEIQVNKNLSVGLDTQFIGKKIVEKPFNLGAVDRFKFIH